MAWFKRKDRQDTDETDVAGPEANSDTDVDADDSTSGDDAAGTAGASSGASGTLTTPDPDDVAASVGELDRALAAAGRARRLAAQRAEVGPFDESEADPDTARVDLGALRLPASQDLELRLEVQDQTKRVLSVTVAVQGSALQLQAFAAPRTAGVWDEIRTEIAAQVVKQGGTADDVEGPFGLELVARVPARTDDGRTGVRPSRFVGVDGPRWFLRGVFTGPAAHDPAAAAPLEALMRGVVVVRGADARPPRELLPLTLPANAQAAPGAAPAVTDPATGSTGDTAGDPPGRPLLTAPERGPEATETR